MPVVHHVRGGHGAHFLSSFSVFVSQWTLCRCVLSGGLDLTCTSGHLAPGLTSRLCHSLNVSFLFQAGDGTIGWRRMGEVERWMTSLSGQCQSHDERLRDLTASLQKLQMRVDQMDGGREGVSSLVSHVVSQRLKEMSADGLLGPKVMPTSPWGAVCFRGAQTRRLCSEKWCPLRGLAITGRGRRPPVRRRVAGGGGVGPSPGLRPTWAALQFEMDRTYLGKILWALSAVIWFASSVTGSVTFQTCDPRCRKVSHVGQEPVHEGLVCLEVSRRDSSACFAPN